MALGVLLRNAEVHVEEQEPARGRGLGLASGEDLLEPGDVDELLVPGKALDGKGAVRSPLLPTGLVRARSVIAECRQSREQRRGGARAIPVDHDLTTGVDVLRPQQLDDVGVIE